MLIRIGYELEFDLPADTSMLLVLCVHSSVEGRLQSPQYISTEPNLYVRRTTDIYGNSIGRILAPAGKLKLSFDNVIQDSGEPEPSIEGAMLHRPEDLPDECLPFLLPSRYCEVDRMTDIAWGLFGKTPPTWQRVKAIIEWTHQHITFGYQYARATKTAMDVFYERQGVCRDFMHLGITMLRAMNIPARYGNCYLGDIGVPRSVSPMDFSAFLEVYIGGRWFAMDPRHNQRRIGRILIARGADAADIAMTTSFGPAILSKFKVVTDELGTASRYS